MNERKITTLDREILKVYNLEMKIHKVLFLLVPLFLIFSITSYAERPTMGISSVGGSSGTVSINYSASDPGGNINTCSWQWSTGTVWYALEDSAVGNNGGKVSGSSYITWNSTAGTYNLDNSSSSTVYFRMRSYNNQGLVEVSTAAAFNPLDSLAWNSRGDRLRTASYSTTFTDVYSYTANLECVDSNWFDPHDPYVVRGAAMELAAGTTYLWAGRSEYLYKFEDHGDFNSIVWIDSYTTVWTALSGLTWDGNNLWGCDGNGYIFKYLDPTIDSYVYWYWTTQPAFSGLTWDGETLWASAEVVADNIALHNMDSNLTISKSFTCAGTPYGLGSDGDFLYVTTIDGSVYGIYKYEIPVSTYSTYGPFTIDNTPSDTYYEPNDSFASAYEIDKDTAVYAYIWDSTDEDIFKFFIVKSGSITITLNPTPSGSDYRIELFDSVPTSLTGFTAGPIIRNLDCTADTTYYARVMSESGTSYSDSETYGLTLSFNIAPVLSWTGETGYVSDGVDPGSGQSGSTFTYRVKYYDADGDVPYSGYPKVWILKGGTTVQTLSMELDAANTAYNGNYSTATKLSSAGTDYTYYFEAKDSNNATATGSPTSTVDAPDVSETGTSVSGIISSDTTWRAVNSPYFVTGNVAVAEGVTLMIEPGVTVKFSTGTYLQIEGTLNAQGTSGNKIIFTSNKESPSPGDWEYIKFTDTSDDTNCIVSYIHIKYADVGVYAESASPTISYSTISYCNSYAIRAGYSSAGDSILITDNYISNNGNGIYSMASPVIRNNVICNNTGKGIETYSGGKANIGKNIISNNQYGIYSYYNNPHISSNTITKNQIGIYCCYEEGNFAPTVMQRNNIAENETGIYTLSNNIAVSWNDIADNGAGIEIGFGSNQSSTITYNNIYSSVTYNIENRGSKDVIATNNWWGTTDTATIDSKIFDYYDDFNYGKVLYDPIAPSELDFTEPNAAPVLDWAAIGGYGNDGVDPETGASTTTFGFMVKYTDADNDAPSGVFLFIEKSGSPYTVYSFLLGTGQDIYGWVNTVGDYVSGVYYVKYTTLTVGNDYTYKFSASDSNSATATGTPTSSVDAPDVTQGNFAPTLEWVGTAGYESDGVSPDAGDTGTNFVFKVKYTDADNDAPLSDYPRVDLGLDGWQTMTEDDGSDTIYSDGKIYKLETYLDTTRDGYFFTAYDANSNIASGEATSQKGGPAVSNPGTYAIYGYVLTHSSAPLNEAAVTLFDGGSNSGITNFNTGVTGFYEFNSITSGANRYVRAEKSGYTFSSGPNGASFLDNNMNVNFFGTAAGEGYYSVSGRCYTADNQGLDNAFVALNYLSGGEFSHVHADSNGDFSFSNVPGDNYELIAKTFSGDTSLHTGDGITTRFVYNPLSSNKAGQNFYLGSAVFESNDFKVWGNVFDPRSTSCEIKFTAMENDNVDVKIYDTAGRVIRSWKTTTGIFSWDGRDANGAVVANGVYYIHIKSNNINKAYPVAIIKK